MPTIVALGEMLIDFAPVAADAAGYPTLKAQPGGAPCNFLAALQKYGCSTAMIGKVGDDRFGRLLIQTAADCGIATEGIVMDASVFTTMAFVTLDAEGNREFSYDVDEGRVYGGFIEEKHPIKLRHDANVVILLPKEEKLDDVGCIQLWKAHQIGFMKHPSSTFFTELRNLLPQAYILHYEETGEAALEVWGKDVEQRFKEADATGENAGTIER